MKTALLAALVAAFVASAAHAQPVVYYAGSTGLPVPVAAATPLPVTGAVSGTVATTTASGANVVEGATADAAGASTMLGQLKQLHADMIAATPAGSNAIGSVTVSALPSATTYTLSSEPSYTVGGSSVILQLQGSGTKTIHIKRITYTALVGTTPTGLGVALSRYSSAASGGVVQTTTIGKMNPANATATAVPIVYSTGATIGTLVSKIDDMLMMSNSATGYMFKSGDVAGGQDLILSGTGDYIALSTGGSPGTISVSIQWTEE